MSRPNALPVVPPLRREPRRIRPPFDVGGLAEVGGQQDRVDALLEALDGVEVGEHDQRIVEWLASWDTSVVGTVASLFYRARQAGGDAR